MSETSLVLRFFFGAFRIIPPVVRKPIFIALFRLLYHVSVKNRMIVIQNLVRAYPDRRSSDIIVIAKGVYRHVAVVAAEFFDILSMTRENIQKWLDVTGLEHYEAARRKGRGILFFTAHFGNWEVMAAYFGLAVRPAYIVYRSLDDPFIDQVVGRVRRHTGNQLIPKGGAARRIMRLLRQNEIVGILIDQNVSWREGVFVDFFGRPAATTAAFAALALQSDAAVLPAFIYRRETGRYMFEIGPEFELIRTGDFDGDVFANTQRMTSIVETHVRAHPDQWFWLHQRWKTKKCQVPADYDTENR